ncbi:MAG: FFLEELY motif protein [Wenzhouxiangella sp.]
MSETAAYRHLHEQIEINQALGERIQALEVPEARALARLQHWQRRRLDATYQDLRDDPRYLPACEFFLDELYGGRDFVERDRQLMRAAPVMRRFLPDHLLAAVGDAMQLQAVSQQFDLALAELLCDVDPITQPDYARAYREQADWEGREHQLSLIRELGELLGQTVQRPLVHRLIRLMHGPAVLAGFGMLQVFLRDGLDAFAEMGPADHFLDTISAREHAGLEAMREGSDWPFERWIGHGP